MLIFLFPCNTGSLSIITLHLKYIALIRNCVTNARNNKGKGNNGRVKKVSAEYKIFRPKKRK